MSRLFITLLGFLLVNGRPALHAAALLVPNHSFESPVASFFGGVSIEIDSWQKSPKPDWYDEGGSFFWNQLTGAFKNTAPGSNNHLDNCDGNQALWLFAVPEVALFQDYDTVDGNDPAPTHAFNATFATGQTYTLRTSVLGGGGGMLEGATLEIALYFREAESNFITVASIIVTNTLAAFPTNTHFYDYEVRVPAVKATDAWAGKNIGIRFLSTVNDEMKGGYWDLDNVRLRSQAEPTLAATVPANGQFTLTVASEPGLVFELLTTTNLSSPVTNWISAGRLTNTTGTAAFLDPATNLNHRFYRARLLP